MSTSDSLINDNTRKPYFLQTEAHILIGITVVLGIFALLIFLDVLSPTALKIFSIANAVLVGIIIECRHQYVL